MNVFLELLLPLLLPKLLHVFIFAATQQCPPGSVSSADDSKCFSLLPFKADFILAVQTCQLTGGRVVSIFNSQDEQIIADHLASQDRYDVWIGGSDVFSHGKWKWTDGSSFDYSHVDSNSPRIIGKNCLAYHGHEKWIPSNCSSEKPFLCARNSDVSAIQPTTQPASSNDYLSCSCSINAHFETCNCNVY
ncbi:hypothetical protein L596_021100 [Steinernema carpocapsae]|uniref:C-type lectin domain-containing protein n=1 Tax=Steinernema carpocapsae TaxID=34508 RepID=A0A4U5MVI7_STECR|nr:hypothetical protein L596_021100 [Steinernema carpocapsae]